MDFEAVVAKKAAELADRMRREEAEREEELFRRKEAAAANFKSILLSTLTQVGGLYAVSQATLLSLFVPQKCPMVIPCTTPPQYDCSGVKISTMNADNAAMTLQEWSTDSIGCSCTSSPLFNYPAYLPPNHLCSMKENLDWFNNSKFCNSVLVLNFATLIVMLAAQSFFWKREVWLINHLDENLSKLSFNALPEEIKPYPDLAKLNTSYNFYNFIYANFLFFMCVSNFIISAVLLTYGDGVSVYSIGSRTYTGLATNTMLISGTVMGIYMYARLSYSQNLAISMFTVTPTSYNTVDENYKQHHGAWRMAGPRRDALSPAHFPSHSQRRCRVLELDVDVQIAHSRLARIRPRRRPLAPR